MTVIKRLHACEYDRLHLRLHPLHQVRARAHTRTHTQFYVCVRRWSRKARMFVPCATFLDSSSVHGFLMHMVCMVLLFVVVHMRSGHPYVC
jgi:hypothetical protein